MTGTKEVSLFPRAEGEYVISEEMRCAHIRNVVSRKTGIDFPSLHISDKLTRIETKPIKDLLTLRSSEFTDSEELKVLLRRLGYSPVMRMFVTWGFNEDGSGVILRLMLALTKERVLFIGDPPLIKAIQEISGTLHPIELELLGGNGFWLYSWDGLGIESHISASNLFDRFIEERFDDVHAGKIRRLAAENKSHKVFDPEPWQRHPTRDDLVLAGISTHFVPESAQEQLLARWDKQLRDFAASITPK